MLGLFEGNPQGANALDLLKADHDEVERMFDDYEDRREDAAAQAKEELVESICRALEVHAQLEEELFYPAFRNIEGMEDLLDEATVEHQSVKTLVAHLEASTPDDMLYDARVKVLSEYVKHHVREEEGEMFPKARASDVDLDDLGRRLAARKEELQQGGVVPAIEEELAPRTRRSQTASGRRAAPKSASRKTPKSRSKASTSQRGKSHTSSRKTSATAKRTSARSR